MAEWQSGYAEDCKSLYAGSIPTSASKVVMKIGIIGNGFVGKATKNGFSKNTQVFTVDPKLKTTISQLIEFKPSFIFVCVPTPMNSDGTQDATILVNVLDDLFKSFTNTPLIIKSTVLPDILQDLEISYPSLIYNPEFLRENHAEEDFINAPFIILGGEKKLCLKVKILYEENSICKSKVFRITDISTASLIKYTINCFLATKVTFFNQIYDIFSKFDSDDSWEDFCSILSLDERIGNSHMQVPGHDGRRGYGGACFPKDTAAFAKLSQKLNTPMSLLIKSIIINDDIRSSYSEQIQREIEQNVNFNFSDE